ncbi:NEL-type E3 ubiquitin ligase domain-containing protein [Pseudomonas fluorescens]|nr:NEL-type E3 ubiquitin ligase domain-containing protein [Pseudomonas fluorescens]
MEGSPSLSAENNGVHYQFLKEKIPQWYLGASDKRQEELSAHQLVLPEWYKKASSVLKVSSKESHAAYRKSLNEVEKILSGIQDILEFAEPLLTQAIQDKFKLQLNVRQVFFARKYRAGGGGRHGFDRVLELDKETDSSLNDFYKGITLLEAALGNFEPDEARKSSCDDCQIITRWSSYGGEIIATKDEVMKLAVSIAPEAFAELCRSLDLGRQYQEHISAVLQQDDAWERAVVETTLSSNQKHMLAVSAQVAYMQHLESTSDGANSGISADAYQMLLQVVGDKPGITLDERAVCYAGLKMLDVELSGILLIGPDRLGSDRVERLVVYIPGDPAQPLKEYASSEDFEADLKARLHTSAYRLFFSRFVPQRHQGTFFRSLSEKLDPSEAYSQAKDYAPIPNQRRVRLSVGETLVQGNLWKYLREERINKIINDARAVAVPTGDEDKKARLKKMESYISAVQSVFNLAAFVVPGLGEIMLAVGAAQMMSEVFEGIEAAEQGEFKEMWEHFSSVALNVAFIAAGAKVIPAINAPGVVDALKPVKMPDGKSLLWKPSLEGYEQKIPTLGTKPDDLGLHQYDGQDILPLEDKYYAVKKEPANGKYRIQHPAREDAYTPELNTNGTGAWSHELEQPQTWEGPELMRRLGHSVSEFSDAELEQIRSVSATDEDVLRRMHVEHEPPAPMLADTIKRFDAYKQVEDFIADMKSDSSAVSAKDHSIDQLLVMTRYGKWPDTVSIRIIDAQAKTTWQYVTPRSAQGEIRTVQIHDAQLRSGELLKTLLEALDENETNTILEQKPGTPRGSLDERIAKLRRKIATVAESRKASLFNNVYNAKSVSNDPRVNLLKARFSNVPTNVVEELLADASSAQRQQMAKWDFADKLQTKPIPLGLAEALRWIQREVRLAHAYEGLYLEALISPDTENLVLNTLKKLPGWSNDLRVEVREGSFSGKLRASVGPEDAASRKVLVRNEKGSYEARDEKDGHLHGADDLYATLQHALPDTHRDALGLPHVGHGPELKTLIRQHALSRNELRSVLKMQPIKPWFKAPRHWVNGRPGYPLSGRGAGVSQRLLADQHRVLRLFPDYTDAQIDRFLEQTGARRELYLVNLEAELQGLRNELRQWESTPSTRTLPDGSGVPVEPYEKKVVAQLLERCWQKRLGTMQYAENGSEMGYELNLRGRTVGELPALTGYFPHVRFLDLSNRGLVAMPNEFLDSFPSIVELKLRNNGLRDFPTQAAEIDSLLHLDVSRNNITLTDEATAALAKMNQLAILQLSHNPLTRLPDFSQMTALVEVRLQATGITEWPVGLRDQAGLEMVDLRDNQLVSFPEWAVNPPPEQAANINKVLKITELNGNPLSDQGLQQYADILARIYLDDDQAGLMPVPPDGPDERGAQGGTLAPSAQRVDRWLRDTPQAELGARKAQWELLDKEALDREASGEAGRAVSESEEFFRLLEKLSETAEYKKAYPDLQARVWAVLDAAEENEVLRNELFKAAGEPETCSDRAALVFSQLEIKVQIHKALALAGDNGAGLELLELAKGLFRLDEVEAFALKDIKERIEVIVRSDISVKEKGRQLLLMDQIEVRLTYRVNLRDRLDLPGQPTKSEYAGLEYVSRAKLRAAEEHVNSLRDSKAEIESIARRDFWGEYLKEKYRSRFDLAYEPIYERMEQLEITKGTMTSAEYNSKFGALAAEIRTAERKLIDLLTPQEILNLEDVDTDA